jgi:hypothetical protein
MDGVSSRYTILKFMKRKFLSQIIWVAIVLILINLSPGMAQQNVSVRVKRSLSIQQISGRVTYDRSSGSRAARSGDRLEAAGDGVTTGQGSTATLQVDTGIGTISVFENTKLRIRELSYADDDGRITRLDVQRGQVRLKLRPFTNRGSKLEINTPAGLSGVRGTEFGLNVADTGKTSVATLTGAVATEAQGVEVKVPEGFQNFTIPGEPPSAAVPLRDDPSLTYRLERILQGNIRNIRLVGQTDPVNTVVVDGIPKAIDRTGQFSVLYLAPSFLRIQVIVTTPLGKTQAYDLALQ